MRLRYLARLAIRDLLRGRVRTGLVVAAIAVTVAMVVATGIVGDSLRAAARRSEPGISRLAPLRVEGGANRGGLSQERVATVASVTGVAAAVPVVRAVTLVDLAGGEQTPVVALGVDCALVAAIGLPCPAEVADAGDGSPIVSARLAERLNGSSSIRTDQGPVDLGEARSSPSLDQLNHGLVVVFPLPAAAEAFGRPGRIDEIYVVPAPGVAVDDVQRTIENRLDGSARVVPSGRPGVGPDLADGLLPFLALFTVVTLGVMLQLVYRVILLIIEDQRHDAAVLEALGASPGDVTAIRLMMAGTVGALGSLVGSALGFLLAVPLLEAPSDLVAAFFGTRLDMRVEPGSLALGFAVGTIMSVVGAAIGIRRRTREDITADLDGHTAVTEEAGAGWRWVTATAFAAATGVLAALLGTRGGALSSWQATVVLAGAFVASTATVASIGAASPWLAATLARVRRIPPRLQLALQLAAGQPVRGRVVASATSAAVIFAIVLTSLLAAVRDGSMAFADQQAAGRVWASTLPPVNAGNVEANPPDDVVAAIAGLEQVERVDLVASLQIVTARGTPVGVTAVSNPATDPYTTLTGSRGPIALARGDVMVGPGLARAEGLRPGSRLGVLGLDGPTALRVGGVWSDPNDNGFSVTLRLGDAERLWGSQPASDLYLQPAAGRSAADVARAVAGTDLDTPVEVATAATLGRRIADDLEGQLASFWLLAWEMYAAAGGVAAATTAIALRTRRRDLATLVAIGATRRDLGLLTAVDNGSLAIVTGLVSAAGALVVALAVQSAAYVLLTLEPSIAQSAAATAGFVAVALAITATSSVLVVLRFRSDAVTGYLAED